MTWEAAADLEVVTSEMPVAVRGHRRLFTYFPFALPQSLP